jgi:integration host factor subunit alpha
MSDNLTRDKLAVIISEKMDLKISTARKFVDVTLARMSDGVVHDEKLMLSGFGTFQVHRKKERIGRNPKTGEDAVISARKSVAFRQAKGLTLRDVV